jgi:hypothetical protein
MRTIHSQTVNTEVTKCDFCDKTTRIGGYNRMYSCVGCGKDLCREHVYHEGFIGSRADVCLDCRSSFLEMADAARVVIDSVYQTADRMFVEWVGKRKL